ncbi:hypothetical protein B0H19DRAFT_1060459 [Mycena capillaripes]|nr:hypothetical protein B0H19DRAFT_1060459 [Mycena capillaripes]
MSPPSPSRRPSSTTQVLLKTLSHLSHVTSDLPPSKFYICGPLSQHDKPKTSRCQVSLEICQALSLKKTLLQHSQVSNLHSHVNLALSQSSAGQARFPLTSSSRVPIASGIFPFLYDPSGSPSLLPTFIWAQKHLKVVKNPQYHQTRSMVHINLGALSARGLRSFHARATEGYQPMTGGYGRLSNGGLDYGATTGIWAMAGSYLHRGFAST